MTAALRWSVALLAVLAIGMAPIVLPALGATFWVNVIAEILIWSLLAASVNELVLVVLVGLNRAVMPDGRFPREANATLPENPFSDVTVTVLVTLSFWFI